MASVLAIISKAIFEKLAPGAAAGTVIDTDRYVSSNAAFDQLSKGDAIFLVTVRPPDERLWLVAIVEAPVSKRGTWIGTPNATPIRDITTAIPRLVFASGAGLAPKKGALGMSLQTPRALIAKDVALLRGDAAVADDEPEEIDEDEALEQIEDELGTSFGTIRLWSDLTKSQQALVRRLMADNKNDDSWGIQQLGLPMFPALRRWMELDPAGPFEKVAAKRPVWRWLADAIRGEVTFDKAIAAIAKVLTADEIADLCSSQAEHDDYQLFERHEQHERGESYANDYVLRVIQLLARLIDASGDDAALAFAKRAKARLAKQPKFWLAAIAVFALAVRARRRNELFPDAYFALATDCDFLGGGCHLYLNSAYREIVEVLSPERRQQFAAKIGSGAYENEDVKGKKRVWVPVLGGVWWFADLIPTAATAQELVDSVVAWDAGPKPTKQALAVFATLGGVCVPPLEKALAAKTKPPHRAVLASALAAITSK